jgi:hypothetical protein
MPFLSPEDAASIALDHTPLTFGKYKGQTPDEVSENDPGWIVWAYDNVKNRKVCSKTLRDACKNDATYTKANNDQPRNALDPLDDIHF